MSPQAKPGPAGKSSSANLAFEARLWLGAALAAQFAGLAKLEKAIRQNLKSLRV